MEAIPSEKKTIIKEGQVEISYGENEVFYNPTQIQNRDLTVLVVREWHKQWKERQLLKKGSKNGKQVEPVSTKMRIFEGLSASGLRSIRFAKELPEEDIENICANDLEPEAVKTIEANIAYNNVGHLVSSNHGDAIDVMNSKRHSKSKFHVVDIDPYGSPAMFIDSAVQSVVDGGLLCITATDMICLARNGFELGFQRYNSIPIASPWCHEQAIRIVLNSLQTSAGRYGLAIKPLLSVFMSFYIRAFVEVSYSKSLSQGAIMNSGFVYSCNQCPSFHIQRFGRSVSKTSRKGNKTVQLQGGVGPSTDEKCRACGGSHKLGGPYYLGPLFDRTFLTPLIARLDVEKEDFHSHPLILSVLNNCAQELINAPFFYAPDGFFKVVKATLNPTLTVLMNAIADQGYRTSLSHVRAGVIKTDCPIDVFWDIVRAWVIYKCEGWKTEKVAGTPGEVIMSQRPKIDNVFKKHGMFKKSERPTSFPTPPPEWGPKRAARGKRQGHDGKDGNEESNKKANVESPESVESTTVEEQGGTQPEEEVSMHD